ncbi:hypothetical protein HMI55_005358, partial [Coelomomyces lativittatus]
MPDVKPIVNTILLSNNSALRVLSSFPLSLEVFCPSFDAFLICPSKSSFLSTLSCNALYEDASFKKASNFFKNLLPDPLSHLYVVCALSRSLFLADNNRNFQLWLGEVLNGKSFLISLLRKHFTEVTPITYKLLFKSVLNDCGTATPDFLSILNSRVVFCEELGGQKISENQLKLLVGNSEITYRNPYKKNFKSVFLKCLIILPLNKMPDFDFSQTSIDDRLVVVQFPVRFGLPLHEKESLYLHYSANNTEIEEFESSSFRLSLISLFLRCLIVSSGMKLLSHTL